MVFSIASGRRHGGNDISLRQPPHGLLETLGPITKVLDLDFRFASGCFILCLPLLPQALGKGASLGFLWTPSRVLTRVWFLKVCHHGHHWEGRWPGRGELEGFRHDCRGVLPGL